MCIVVYDDEKLDAFIYDMKAGAVRSTTKIILEAKKMGLNVILTENAEETYHRLHTAGSTRAFLNQLEADATIIK